MTTPRITSPFGFENTAADVVAGLDLHGIRALVTGGAGGIGVETARALATAGAEVTIAARDLVAAEKTAADIGTGTVRVAYLDLVDRASIDALAEAYAGPLHLLVNNAGVMAVPELRLSPEGHELQFATNHLGHFRLTLALRDNLRQAQGARVVSLSSRAHLNSPVDLDDVDFARRPYDPSVAYAQSKTANALFAVGLTRAWSDDGIVANAVHPGAIADSNLARYYPADALDALRSSGRYTYKTLEQGAATSVFVGTWPGLATIGGRYFENSQQAVVGDPTACGTDAAGVAAYALDPELADRLWVLSLEMNR